MDGEPGVIRFLLTILATAALSADNQDVIRVNTVEISLDAERYREALARTLLLRVVIMSGQSDAIGSISIPIR
jgi:hypothetical protein